MTEEAAHFTAVRNPKWANATHTQIECEVNFRHLYDEWVSFCADPTDMAPYSKEIFDRCAAGEFGDVVEYVSPFVMLPQSNILLPDTVLREHAAAPIPRVIL